MSGIWMHLMSSKRGPRSQLVAEAQHACRGSKSRVRAKTLKKQIALACFKWFKSCVLQDRHGRRRVLGVGHFRCAWLSRHHSSGWCAPFACGGPSALACAHAPPLRVALHQQQSLTVASQQQLAQPTHGHTWWRAGCPGRCRPSSRRGLLAHGCRPRCCTCPAGRGRCAGRRPAPAEAQSTRQAPEASNSQARYIDARITSAI